MIENVLSYLESCPWSDKPALVDECRTVTYGTLLEEARAIGTAIAAKGICRQPVGVVIGRDVESIVMFLGVAYSGNFYVPLDRDMPSERLARMMEVLEPAVLVGKRDLPEQFCSYPVLAYESLRETVPDETLLRKHRAGASDPLYAMFTSGSTGVPKCVLVSHGNVIDRMEQFAQAFAFGPEDRFGNQAPFDFDVSVKDIYQTLRQGATMVVLPAQLFSAPGNLVRFLNGYGITCLFWAVSAMHIVARFRVFRTELPQHLRYVLFSGEVMPVKTLKYWQTNLPDVCYVNLYGPTEITCNCTYWTVDREIPEDGSLPIGMPFPGTEIDLLADDGAPAGPGMPGEICVSGKGVAMGYYHAPERTAPVFVQGPDGRTMYRTGDLGVYNEAGELMFLSRRDDQIKHMGHRIELGEVESAVNSIPFVDLGCCVYDTRREKIVLYYQAECACDREILLALRTKIPKYMWPNRLIHREDLPRNAHGKIDRTALKQELA